MPLNPEEFGSVEFFHGSSTPGLESIEPAQRHGGRQSYPGISKADRAYATTAEEEAWKWAGDAAKGGGVERVYEIEPQGELTPDTNLAGAQFEMSQGKVRRELPGPIGSQLKLFPEDGRQYTPQSELLQSQRQGFAEQEIEARLNRGFQGVPQTHTLLGFEELERTREGKLPDSARTNRPEASHRKDEVEQAAHHAFQENRSRHQEQSARGLRLRKHLEGPVEQPPSLGETFDAL